MIKNPEAMAIRHRGSYREWKGISEFLDTKPSKAEILKRMHQLLDDHSAYGSMTQSNYSRESLELVLEEESLQ